MIELKAFDRNKEKIGTVLYIDFMKQEVGIHALGYGSYATDISLVDFLEKLDIKDKNGKDIYVGDKVSNGVDVFTIEKLPFVGFVKTVDGFQFGIENLEKHEIVGNIFGTSEPY